MATNTDNVIMLFKGDDTGGSFGRTVSFVISVEAGASMDGCRAEFEYAGIVKEIAPPIVDGETRTIEYSAEETAKMPLGAGRGVLRVIDAGGKVRTATNTLPVMVTDCVPLAYPGESVISVTFKAADYDSLSGKPQINGHELTGNKSAADLGLAPAGNYATKADATLTPVFDPDPTKAKWVCSPAQMTGEEPYSVAWREVGMNAWNWVLSGGDGSQSLPQEAGDSNAGEVTFWIPSYGIGQMEVEYVTATRVPVGYYLGSDNTKVLSAKEALDALAAAVAAKYTKPSGGIPATDLAAAVQTSLGKADTALQTHQQLGVGAEALHWEISSAATDLTIDWDTPSEKWVLKQNGVIACYDGEGNAESLSLFWAAADNTLGVDVTATRQMAGWVLGTQSDKPLATAEQGAKADTAVQPSALPSSETWTFEVDDGQGGTTTITKSVAVYAAGGNS